MDSEPNLSKAMARVAGADQVEDLEEEEDVAPNGSGKDAFIRDLLNNPSSSTAAQVLHYFMILLIVGSTVSTIVETMPEFRNDPRFFPVEMVITSLFTIEFAVRLFSCETVREFVANGYNYIDFLAILPGYAELLFPMLMVRHLGEREAMAGRMQHNVHKAAGSMRTLRMLRLVRVIRVMRLAKVARHSQVLSIILAVIGNVAQSGLVVVLMLLTFTMVLSASLIYLFESEHCEETGVDCNGPAAFVSIPASFWWAISTLTTVGYGDMIPHTVAGKIIAGATAVTGISVVAISVAIVSVNFRASYLEERAKVMSRARRTASKRQGRRASLRGSNKAEMNALLANFEQNSANLIEKLTSTTRGHRFEELNPMLEVIKDHVHGLADDLKVFITNVLPEEEEVGFFRQQSGASPTSPAGPQSWKSQRRVVLEEGRGAMPSVQEEPMQGPSSFFALDLS